MKALNLFGALICTAAFVLAVVREERMWPAVFLVFMAVNAIAFSRGLKR